MDRSVAANKIVGFLVNKSNLVIVLTVLLSCILTYPFINMSPTQQASPDPPGEVYDMQVDIDNKELEGKAKSSEHNETELAKE